jgi:hypothetical protein
MGKSVSPVTAAAKPWIKIKAAVSEADGRSARVTGSLIATRWYQTLRNTRVPLVPPLASMVPSRVSASILNVSSLTGSGMTVLFSPDGSKLVWASNRHDAKPHETNVFIADWVN